MSDTLNALERELADAYADTADDETRPEPTQSAERAIPEAHDDELAGDDAEASASGTGAKSTAKSEAAVLRRGIAKYSALLALQDRELTLLAAASGSRADAVELAVAITTSGLKLTALSDVLALAAAVASDPFAAVFAAAGLERDAARGAWALLSALGLVAGNLPGKDQQAATELARAAGRLTDEQRAQLDDVRRLARK